MKRFSEEFKRQVVLEVLSGKLSKEAAKRKYSLKGNTQVLYWIRNYQKSGRCSVSLSLPVMAKQERTTKEMELESKIKLLEQQLQDQSLLREMYDRMIDIAEKEYKIPIRKKPDTK